MRATLPALLALAPLTFSQEELPLDPDFELRPGEVAGQAVLTGVYHVWEDREARAGRRLGLRVIVLPASGPDPRPDPLFWFAGGPGGRATASAAGLAQSPHRVDRDIVMIDQRGTADDHLLACRLQGSDDDLQGYLEPIFQLEYVEACRRELEQRYDLTKYTTPIAMDDVNEVRAALGYERINVMGGSYGTRAALVYMRRHAETVRSAVLMGCAPIAFTNPLYHAPNAQEALDRVFAAVREHADLRAAYPRLEEEFAELLERLDASPAEVRVRHPGRPGESATVRIDGADFAEALRMMMYGWESVRRVPLLIHDAYRGDLEPFAQRGLEQNRAIRNFLAFGMLLCVTCNEDVPRIDPATVEAITGDTFLGSDRVLQQMAACARWPDAPVPAGYGEPVSVDVPTLVISGVYDPVTPPRWGEETARHLPNSVHVEVPGSHFMQGPWAQGVAAQVLERGSVEGLDLSLLEGAALPGFLLPGL